MDEQEEEKDPLSYEDVQRLFPIRVNIPKDELSRKLLYEMSSYAKDLKELRKDKDDTIIFRRQRRLFD